MGENKTICYFIGWRRNKREGVVFGGEVYVFSLLEGSCEKKRKVAMTTETDPFRFFFSLSRRPSHPHSVTRGRGREKWDRMCFLLR